MTPPSTVTVMWGPSPFSVKRDGTGRGRTRYSMIPALDRHIDLLTRAPVAERIPDLVTGMDVLQHLHMYVVPGIGRVYVTSSGSEVSPGN